MAPFHWRGLVVAAAALSLACTAGSAVAAETRPQGIGPEPVNDTGIVVNIPARTLYWYSDGELVRSFPVGVGKPGTQTPPGSYKVQNMAVDPWWLPPSGGPAVPPGPANPLGTRWIGFFGGYGIHGNNNPDSIGGQVSLGCVRMYVPDVEWLYEQVTVGTPVEVIYETALIEYGPEGERYLAIYPDGYSLEEPDPEAVLAAAGLLPGTVTVDGPGRYLLDVTATLNEAPLPAVMHRSRPYVHARRLADELAASVQWDETAAMVRLEGRLVPTAVQDGAGYVDAAEAAALLGVEYQWMEEEGLVALAGLPLYLDGELMGRQALRSGESLLAPVRKVAEAAGARVEWDTVGGQALVDGKPVPTTLHGGTAYAPADLLGSRLGLSVEVTAAAVRFGQ